VLTVLAGTTRPLTGREVARLAGRPSHKGVLDSLHRLCDHGLVDHSEAGRALLFTLNRDHLAAPAVQVLAGMRHELLTRIRTAVRDWTVAPIHLSLFGSAARGDGDVNSDIDLFLVRPTQIGDDDRPWAEKRDALAEQIERWTGNRTGIVEVGEEELERLGRQQPPVVSALRRDAIVVAGPPIAHLLPEPD
jgi:hypothetical protein